ncbi:MAG: transposase, partial [Nitrospirae bacterium]|nr:transposase [Nitrospirota bacterium]
MFIWNVLPFVNDYVASLDKALTEYKDGCELSSLQKRWLSICIMGIIVTNTICWKKNEGATIGKYRVAALSWMFRRARIVWELLVVMSVKVIVEEYGIKDGCLCIDDSDRKRTKNSKKIGYIHKIKDKGSGGYIMGQNIVF